jgi:hypothetical protein
MSAQDLQQRYFESLLDKIASVDFPSNQLMDRAEALIRTSEQAEAYCDVLFDKSRSLYPSLHMIDRIHRVVLVLERTERIKQLQQAT